MKHRILTAVVVVPLFIVVSTTPAHALLGSILAGIQRAQMIINQGLQIYEQKIAKLTMDGQLTEIADQFTHLKEQAHGTVGALKDPFTTLASTPTKFIGLGLSWKNDFTGIARDIASNVENMGETGKSFRESWQQRLNAADTVSEADILALFRNPDIGALAADEYLTARQKADERLVLAHATSDTAANLIIAARAAVDSYEGLQANTNVSNTALAQSQVTGAVTQGHLNASMVQLMAFQAAKQAAENYENEIARREELAEWVQAQRDADALFDASQAGMAARRDSMREGLLFPTKPSY